MGETFLTSDTHFGHSKIIELCYRPFASTEEMTETLIERWNKVVKPGDLIYHLGDFALIGGRYLKFDQATHILSRLNGQKFLVLGNHDAERLWKNWVGGGDKWITVTDVKKIKVSGQIVWLSHYAHRVWPNSGHRSWHLYGHSHNTLEDDPHALSMDVGVDTHDFYPYSLEEIRALMEKKVGDWIPVDHHNEMTKI